MVREVASWERSRSVAYGNFRDCRFQDGSTYVATSVVAVVLCARLMKLAVFHDSLRSILDEQ